MSDSSIRRSLVASVFAAALLPWSLPAFADSSVPQEPGKQWCQSHPDECAQMRQKREAFCAKNPQTCAIKEQQRDARKAFCEQNPDQCKALKEERQQRREDAREYCAQNPQDCEAKKQQMRDRQDARIERRRAAVDQKGEQ